MCLFAIAHGVSARFPLVIAANRDEDYERPTLVAAFWTDEPAIAGGRDALHGGSWLAIDRRGRFAAVTNLRGSHGVAGKPSRGGLVLEFVAGDGDPVEYVRRIEARTSDYAGFHLVAGVAGRDVAQLSGTVTLLDPGIHALSNADPGVRWPKVEIAEAEMKRLVGRTDAAELCTRLMAFLTGGRSAVAASSSPRSRSGELGSAATPQSPIDASREIFIAGDRYGTRSSTVIIVDTNGEVLFVEQSFMSGGALLGTPREMRFSLSPPGA